MFQFRSCFLCGSPAGGAGCEAKHRGDALSVTNFAPVGDGVNIGGPPNGWFNDGLPSDKPTWLLNMAIYI